MEHARSTLMSASDHLVMQQASDVRHEFVAGQVFALVGVRDSHDSVALNIAASLKAQLRGRCKVYIGDVTPRADIADAFHSPGVFVTCDPRDTEPYVERHASLVLFEVLLPRTEGVDRREELRDYRLLESSSEHAIVPIEDRCIALYRQEADGEWPLYRYGANEPLKLKSVGTQLSLTDVFEGVVLH